ncbi:MAG: hypothetical protein KY452_07495 [Actinobacteria bacterium]|nr:hypothetical protein [Actinomycetota bacterium]
MSAGEAGTTPFRERSSLYAYVCAVGGDEGRLERSALLSGVGDGLVATTLPLLAAGATRDPLAVAAVFAAQHLPWAVVAVVGSALVGDSDRRTVLGTAATLRAFTIGFLGVAALTGGDSLVVLVAVALVVGVGEALADGVEEEAGAVLGHWQRSAGSSGSSLRPRGMYGLVGGLAAAGLLYEVMAPVPLLAAMGLYALAALAALWMRSPVPAPSAPDGGWRGLTPLRPGTGLVTAVAAAGTATGSAVVAVLVLFALDDLGLGAPAFGLLLAGLAVAAAGGGLAAPSIGRLLGLRTGLVIAFLAAGAGHAAAGTVADPARPLIAAAGLGGAAAAGMVAAVLVRALLHFAAGRALDAEGLRAFHIRVWGAIPVGALAGGLVARLVGVAPSVVGAGALSVAIAVAAASLPTPARAGSGTKTG